MKDEEADVRPVTGRSQRPAAATTYTPSVRDIGPRDQVNAALDQRCVHLLEVLSAEEQGMTIGQLSSRLASPREGVETLVEGLVKLQLVGKLNTVIPTYVCRGEATPH